MIKMAGFWVGIGSFALTSSVSAQTVSDFELDAAIQVCGEHWKPDYPFGDPKRPPPDFHYTPGYERCSELINEKQARQKGVSIDALANRLKTK